MPNVNLRLPSNLLWEGNIDKVLTRISKKQYHPTIKTIPKIDFLHFSSKQCHLHT